MPRPSLGQGTSAALPARFGLEDELLVRVGAAVAGVSVSELIRRAAVLHAHEIVIRSAGAPALLEEARRRVNDAEGTVSEVVGDLVADRTLNTRPEGTCAPRRRA